MAQPQIGMGNEDPFAFDRASIDLQDESLPPIAPTITRGCYTIDSDEGENSIEDDEEQFNDPDDSDSSEDESTSAYNVNQGGESKRNDARSADAAEVVNIDLEDKQEQHHSSQPESSTSTSKRSIIPSAISSRFPSYMLKGSKRSIRKDKNGNHKRLTTTEDDTNDDEENNSQRPLMKEPVNSFRDPAHFPMEQCTDARNGEGQGLGSYSYATSDPSDVQYTPTPLRKMGFFQYDDLEQRRKKLMLMGLFVAIFISSIIGISVIILRLISRHVSDPPKSLEKMCNISSISTEEGHQQCEIACQDGNCCMTPDKKSCFKGQEEVCSLYAPCAALYSGKSNDDLHVLVPPAPINIAEICSIDNIKFVSDYIQCKAVCEGGGCCSSVYSSEKQESCSSTHTNVCAEYEPCNALEKHKDTHGTPVDLVNSKCTSTLIMTKSGVVDCENACQPRSCCFADSKKKNCYDDNEIWCDQFSACTILTEDDTTKKLEGENIQQNDKSHGKCNKNAMDMSSDDHTICQSICDPATCCFYDDASCSRQIDCEEYSSCEKFLTSESPFRIDGSSLEDILPPPGRPHTPGPSQSDVEEACNKDLSSPQRKDSCSQMCANYSCCFEDDYDQISCHEESTCQKYSSCEKLANNKDGLNVACSVDNLVQEGGFTRCEEYCGDHLCCFNGEDCEPIISQQCSQYEECNIFSNGLIKGMDTQGITIFDYENACSTDRLSDRRGKAFCSSICEQHKCCWDDTVPCQSDTDRCASTTIQACGILHKEHDKGEDNAVMDTMTSSLPELKSVCQTSLVLSKERTFEKSCIELCEDSKCCYDGTCDYEDTFCQVRTLCSSVNLVSLACSKDITRKACENACDTFTCCSTGGCHSIYDNQCKQAQELCPNLK